MMPLGFMLGALLALVTGVFSPKPGRRVVFGVLAAVFALSFVAMTPTVSAPLIAFGAGAAVTACRGERAIASCVVSISAWGGAIWGLLMGGAPTLSSHGPVIWLSVLAAFVLGMVLSRGASAARSPVSRAVFAFAVAVSAALTWWLISAPSVGVFTLPYVAPDGSAASVVAGFATPEGVALLRRVVHAPSSGVSIVLLSLAFGVGLIAVALFARRHVARCVAFAALCVGASILYAVSPAGMPVLDWTVSLGEAFMRAQRPVADLDMGGVAFFPHSPERLSAGVHGSGVVAAALASISLALVALLSRDEETDSLADCERGWVAEAALGAFIASLLIASNHTGGGDPQWVDDSPMAVLLPVAAAFAGLAVLGASDATNGGAWLARGLAAIMIGAMLVLSLGHV